MLELLGFACRRHFGAKLNHSRLEHSGSPPAFIDFLSAHLIDGLLTIHLLRDASVEGKEFLAATALLRPGLVRFISQEMLQRRQQERAEPAFLWMDLIEIVLLQQPREETLGQVFGVRRTVPLPANVSVERIPVTAAQLFQGFRRLL